MKRTLFLIAALAAMPSWGALAQDGAPMIRRGSPQARGFVAPNGRCNGLSYGTGARRCNTRSGGPAGGISGRN